MKKPLLLIPLIFCLGLLMLTGCREGKSKLENPKIPRLLLEPRGLNYGSPSNGAKTVKMPNSGVEFTVGTEALINEFEIINVELVRVDLGLALMLQLTDRGARALYRASVASMGSMVVLTINGNPIGARRLDGAIGDGKFYTFVELTPRETEQLVLDIKATIIQLQKKK